MRRLLVVAAIGVAATVVLVWSLPPARLALLNQPDGTIAGILHVHSNQSDGRGTPDEIAAAASRVGLKFVVFTDHGNGTSTPDPPAYRSGVLCLDGVEISTTGGHYVVLGMPAAPYPLAGDPRDVVDDVKRFGGFGIAAHPDSPKPELRWREWTAPFDGIEIVNPDTSWRQWVDRPSWRPKLHLFKALISYPVRPSESIAALLQPSGVLDQWEAISRRRRVVTIAGIDAHAKLAIGTGDPVEDRVSLPVPGYESSFRTLSVHLRPDGALTGDGPTDAAIVYRAIRAGHLYTAIDAVASPPSFDFMASNAYGTVRQGDELAAGGTIALRVRSNAPPSFTTTVWKGSTVVAADRHEQDFTIQAEPGPGVYWVDIKAPARAAPWIMSNAIYVRDPNAPARLPTRSPATHSTSLFDGKNGSGWRVEQHTDSLAALDVAPIVGGSELRLRFGLGGGPAGGQYAALVALLPSGVGASDRLAFTVRGERPMRISVQLRAGDERWQRSVYVDKFSQDYVVYFDELTPIAATPSAKPALNRVDSILFVIDTNNTKPGTSGRLWIQKAQLQN